jgi:hypothetical protein
MRLSIICGYLLLVYMSWAATRRLHALLIARRSRAWRAVVGVIGLSLGWSPASEGSITGYGLLAAGGAASASLAADACRKVEEVQAGRRHQQRRGVGAVRPPDERVDAALTALDQAALHRAMLGSSVRHLERASDADDIELQRASAGEVRATADQLHDALEVVLEERHRIAGRA